MTEKTGLHWTSHPVIDYGIATLTVFSNKPTPEEVTYEDLEQFAKFAERAYFTPALSGYLTVLFTSNFINPSWIKKAKKEKRGDEYYYAREFVSGILRSFQSPSDPSLPNCAYCGRQSIKQRTSVFAFRDLVPMLTGRGIINFFPGGQSGLPLCGLCTTAIQAIAIGAPMCSGRALIVSADDPMITLGFVKNWLPQIRSRIQLSEATRQKPPNIGRPLTRTVEALTLLEQERRNWDESGLSMFHMTNSGQGPDIAIYELPTSIVRFVMRAKAVRYRHIWNDIVNRAWEPVDKEKNLERRNYLYEDLFSLPSYSGRFIRTYFLQQPTKRQGPQDPRISYKSWEDAQYIKWPITQLFLEEVMSMEKTRIEAIRNLGDRIADEISDNNDKGLWWGIYRVQNYYGLRNILIRESQKSIKSGREPLVRFDSFLEIFEEGEELARADWRLAWDLVLIRVIEQLYEKKWFEEHKDTLESEENIQSL